MNQHSLRQHMQVCRLESADLNLSQHLWNSPHVLTAQVHEPRKVSCPLCGVTKFRNAANAVQHIEAVACTACRGRDNARSQVREAFKKINFILNIITADLPLRVPQ